jgi:hypothetical protein
MKATLVFQSHESWDVSVGMVFIPCLCWVIGNRKISNPKFVADLPQPAFEEKKVFESSEEKKILTLAVDITS